MNRTAATFKLIAVLLLLAFWTQAAGNLFEQSPVVDEPTHIARAQAYWRTDDFRLQRGHPPLIHALSGLAMQLEPGLPSPVELPGWADTDRMSVARHFLWDPGRPADRIIFMARVPVLMLAMVLGAVLFRWANQRLGRWPALGALFLFAFDPNLLAHSVLITTDMAVTVFIFLAAYALDRWMLRRDLRHSVGAGVALGLALAAKFSAVILGPVAIAVAGLAAWRWRGRAWRPILGALAVWGLLAALVIGIVYRFEYGPLDLGATRLNGVPAPSFWSGLLTIVAHNEAGHPAFLFGQISPGGWWYYFIVAFLLKTPLPTLLLLAASLVTGAARLSSWLIHPQRRGEASQRNARHNGRGIAPVWIIMLALYFLFSLRVSINVGYRHVLPLVPFVILIGAAQIPRCLPSLPRLTAKPHVPRQAWDGILRFTFYVLLAWHLAGAALIYPYHLAYFNELTSGPDGGYRALVDSNLDWGQDVRRLERYLDASGIQEPYLTLFAGSPPDYYGIQARPLPGSYQPPTEFGFHRLQPAPGVYVIGASNLQGLRLNDPDTFDTFRRQIPLARVGHTLFVYRVEEHPPLEKWVAICYSIDGPMDGEEVDSAFGRSDLRKIFYDCLNGWIYPSGGAPGWYVVPSSGGRPAQAAHFLLGAPEVFHERGYIEQEAYSVHRFDSPEAPKMSRTESTLRIGPATFLGYTLDPSLDSAHVQRGRQASLITYWQAEQTGQPLLSILAHLDGPGGLIATGDGLAVPAEIWQTGDVIAQAHTFEIPADAPPGDYTLYVGIYSIVSGQREPASQDGQPVADGRLPVATLHVVE